MIGIYAPYDLTDATAMAISLAEYASTLGYNVSYFCPTTKYVNIHKVWDRKVKTLRDITYIDWLYNCDHLVWFSAPSWLKANARNTLVLTNALASPRYQSAEYRALFDCVVVPSIAMSEFLCDKWATSALHPVPWHMQQPFTNKPVRNAGIQDILVPITGLSAKFFGRQLLCILGITLSKYRNVRFTLATYKRLDHSCKEILASMQREFPGRISLQSIGPHDTRADVCRQYDWVLYLPYKDDVFVPAIQALSVGTPVITLAIPPANECVLHEYSGFCIGSDTIADPYWGAQIVAKPSGQHIVSALGVILNNPEILDVAMSQPWGFMDIRKRTFDSVWKTIWDEPIPTSK
jgi:hypothetical protein